MKNGLSKGLATALSLALVTVGCGRNSSTTETNRLGDSSNTAQPVYLAENGQVLQRYIISFKDSSRSFDELMISEIESFDLKVLKTVVSGSGLVVLAEDTNSLQGFALDKELIIEKDQILSINTP